MKQQDRLHVHEKASAQEVGGLERLEEAFQALLRAVVGDVQGMAGCLIRNHGHILVSLLK